MSADISIRFWLDCLAGCKDKTIDEHARSLTDLDWQVIDTLSQRHELVPMLYWQLKMNGAIACVSTQLQDKWQRSYHASALKNLRREGELRAILKEMAHVSITPILFKGAMLAFFTYPTPACRPMSDLDLWVSKEEMPRAQAVLEKLGYEQRSSERRPLIWQAERDGEIQMFGQNKGQGLVELHWGAFQGEWLHRIAYIDRSSVETRTRPVILGSFSARVLEPTDALIQVALHLVFCSPLSGEAIRPLMDIFLLGHKINDWNIVIERAKQWHVADGIGLVLALSDKLFGLPDARSAIRQLRPNTIRQGMVQPFVSTSSLLNPRDEVKIHMRWIFRLALVDRFKDILRILFWGIWPEEKWLTMVYGQSNWRIRVEHVMRSLGGKI
jgi:hypothetical protein